MLQEFPIQIHVPARRATSIRRPAELLIMIPFTSGARIRFAGDRDGVNVVRLPTGPPGDLSNG
jgi:hypothetical protein